MVDVVTRLTVLVRNDSRWDKMIRIECEVGGTYTTIPLLINRLKEKDIW